MNELRTTGPLSTAEAHTLAHHVYQALMMRPTGKAPLMEQHQVAALFQALASQQWLLVREQWRWIEARLLGVAFPGERR